jgi:hypothetical protein
LFRLLDAPLFLRQPSCLFPALPFFFLVCRNPGLQRTSSSLAGTVTSPMSKKAT